MILNMLELSCDYPCIINVILILDVYELTLNPCKYWKTASKSLYLSYNDYFLHSTNITIIDRVLIKNFITMEEIMTDLSLSIKIDNELLLEEITDNYYHFENEEEYDNWVNEIIKRKWEFES